MTIGPLDDALRSADALTAESRLIEPGRAGKLPVSKPNFSVPSSAVDYDIKPPRYKLTGTATFYDNGTTAMRLPRGTIVIVCGKGGCLERVVNDYGPQLKSRIIDLYRPDFFKICGCPSWSGVVDVTVYVY